MNKESRRIPITVPVVVDCVVVVEVVVEGVVANKSFEKSSLSLGHYLEK